VTWAAFADAQYFKKPYNIDQVIDAIAACVEKTPA
jgi:hypothetical protein